MGYIGLINSPKTESIQSIQQILSTFASALQSGPIYLLNYLYIYIANYIRICMRAETSVTTTLLHSKAELPMSDFRFSVFRILRCRTTRARFASVTIFWLSPAFQRAASRGRGGYVCLARTFVTNWMALRPPCYENWQNKWVTKRRRRRTTG